MKNYKQITAWAPFGMELTHQGLVFKYPTPIASPGIYFGSKEEVVQYCKEHYQGGGYEPISLDKALEVLGLNSGELTISKQTIITQLTAEKDNLLTNSLTDPSIIVMPYKVMFILGNSVNLQERR